MQPHLYSAKDHKICLTDIDQDALYIVDKLAQAGYTAYLVGGSVRDLFLKQKPKDFDIVTSAKPEEIKKIFSRCILIGRRFRLAHVRFGKKIIEVSTFRAGDNTDAELILRDNLFGSPQEDVLRRDFTLNGLFYDPKEQLVIDYVGGVEDLNKHLLRTIGQPQARFKQDPVRMIRLLKFQARFGFQIAADTLAAMQELREEILKSSPARLLEEFLRMLESGAAAKFLDLLHAHEFLPLLLPKLPYTPAEQNYLHAVDAWMKTRKPQVFVDRSVLLASFFFPSIQKHAEEVHFSFPRILSAMDELMDVATSSSFFAIPRRMRSLASFIVASQFRLTPSLHKKPTRFRLARHPDFPFCLQFLRLRAALDPSLEESYQIWKQHHRREE